MSGIYIQNMEMPHNCFLCQLSYMRGERLYCYLTKDEVLRAKIAPECPLILVHNHGRLVDADAVMDAIERTDWYHQNESKDMVLGANSQEHQAWYKEQEIYAAVENVPTIIPSDKDGAE